MSFELRGHTADVGVAATGDTQDEVFAAVADGLAAAMCEEWPAGVGERFSFAVEAEGREALLFDYLDQLIYERDVRGVLPVDNRASVTRTDDETWRVEASARGVPLDVVEAREVKAVTYSELSLEETPDGWQAYVVFDV
ncbi:archease [Haloarchaeobius sp. HRN-SO-5]|uniref:archease n=1 Tax=Haloarchaeobius sp. HRN-SO-5 TaxID=3446118 RepID=UPI003EBA405F